MQAVGIKRQTFYKWLKDPAFRDELRRRLDDLTEAAVGQLKSAAGEAVQALRGLLESESESVRLRAALGILDQIHRAKELDIVARLEEIEQFLDERKNDKF